jgi:acyl-CoA reductase-like NAD-dependent aldehyde dehydrogenase
MANDIKQYGLLINNEWVNKSETMDVLNKYSGEVAGTTAVADKADVDAAVAAAKAAVKLPLSPYERYSILSKVASLLQERREQFAQVMAAEVGKPIRDSRIEVDRAAQTLIISAEEAKRIHGEGIPVEASPGSENRMAFTLRVPVGVVAAITPFNVPLNLVCHKVGPAIAAGNSVVLKPAEPTPFMALMLAELFIEAGLPAGRLNVLTGVGPDIGEWLTSNPDVAMFSFTGSPRVGHWIRQRAGIRKVALELGNNSATIVHHDCNLDQAAALVAGKSFNNAGQVCISVQRVYVHESVQQAFLDKLTAQTAKLVVGNPFEETTDIGPMISLKEAERVESWIQEAVSQGARIVTGGTREGAVVVPTILADVNADMKVSCQEVFGPVVSVDTYSGIEEAIAKVNNSSYGLQAGLFTKDLGFAMKAAKEIEVGGLIVNDASAYRADAMPYGGVKMSGNGKEGPKYVIEEMTEERIVVFNL